MFKKKISSVDMEMMLLKVFPMAGGDGSISHEVRHTLTTSSVTPILSVHPRQMKAQALCRGLHVDTAKTGDNPKLVNGQTK